MLWIKSSLRTTLGPPGGYGLLIILMAVVMSFSTFYLCTSAVGWVGLWAEFWTSVALRLASLFTAAFLILFECFRMEPVSDLKYFSVCFWMEAGRSYCCNLSQPSLFLHFRANLSSWHWRVKISLGKNSQFSPAKSAFISLHFQICLFNEKTLVQAKHHELIAS